jgi:hypothetical protein
MLFSSLPEERTHRLWLCDLGDLCGEVLGVIHHSIFDIPL